ncbi:MAG TPA: FKBP-type peptidyl-prolyl cis-trans isomerase [Longimicrobium sp.]
MKLKTLFAAAAAAALVAACGTDSPTASITIGPPPALPAGAQIVTTASGLQYADFNVGSGAVAQSGNQVAVHYTLWLSNNTGIETSRGGPAVQFTLGDGNLIAGFNEGVTGMRVGGNRRLIIPPALGYGSQPVVDQNTGRVVIPANSTLIFDIELVAVQP